MSAGDLPPITAELSAPHLLDTVSFVECYSYRHEVTLRRNASQATSFLRLRFLPCAWPPAAQMRLAGALMRSYFFVSASSSSKVRGQSCFSRRERLRSANSLPPVWQGAQ